MGIPLLLSVWGVPLGYALAAAFAVAHGSICLEEKFRKRCAGILQQVLPHGADRQFAGQAVPVRMRVRETCLVHAVRLRLP
ncbi:MAG: hypothetical protein ACLSUW_03480 [Akkermansia sp.]